MEQFGFSMVEALSCEVPVIASNVSGPKAIINGETGFLIPPDDAEMLARKMILLMEDEELRQRLGKKGRGRVLANFTREVIADRLFQYLTDEEED